MLRQAKPKTGSITFHHIDCEKKGSLQWFIINPLYTWVVFHPQQIPCPQPGALFSCEPSVPAGHFPRCLIYTVRDCRFTHSWAGKKYAKKDKSQLKASATKLWNQKFQRFPPFTSLGDKTHSKYHPLFQTPRLDHWNRFIPRLQCWHKR